MYGELCEKDSTKVDTNEIFLKKDDRPWRKQARRYNQQFQIPVGNSLE